MRGRLTLLLLLCVAPSRVWADEYGASATVKRASIVASHPEDPSASGTSLAVDERVSVPRSLADVVREAPGARVQSTGGLGAFSSLSLRGADGDEAMVMLDEIPLVTADGGPFDLSLFPPELFERVDVFRGGAPVWLGSGAIAGVLRLVPRRSPRFGRVQAGAGGGSFGLWQAQAGAAVDNQELRLSSYAVVRSTRGDYPYFDDKTTLYDPTDDEELTRKNADLTDANGVVDLSLPAWGGRFHVVLLGHERTGGFPGPASSPTPNIRRQSARLLGGVSYERRAGGGRSPRRRFQALVSGGYNLDRYSDLYGELGTSRRWETDDQAYRLFTRLGSTVRLVRWLESTFVGSYAFDFYDRENALAFPKPAPSSRHTLAGALELTARSTWGPVLFELRPSARIEGSFTDLHADAGLSGALPDTARVLAPTARMGAAMEPVRGLALSGSVATGQRLPSMFELFGDRGLVLPAPELRPVKSVTYDGGVTYRFPWSSVRGNLEVRGFRKERRDAIAVARTAQWQVRHRNISSVEQRGLEAGLSLALSEYASLVGAATLLKTETALGKRLPLRPQWTLFARPEARLPLSSTVLSELSVGSELSYRSFVYADDANLAPVSECFTTAFTMAALFFRGRVRLSGRMDDALDVRCHDVVGYPLPGRSLFFMVSVQERTHA